MERSRPPAISILSPLKQRLFLALWIAQMVSNIGTWMQSTAAAWMMTGLDPSPVMVALVQTASNLPVFFLGFSAGAIADVVDRRRLLIFTQFWMLVSAGALAYLTFTGSTTPLLLLALTFSLGIGSALMMPGFQATFPEIVGRDKIPSAVTLNSVSYNVARSVGPALGGIVVALAGPGPAFLLNAISFIGVIAVLVPWKPKPKRASHPAESLRGAVRAGIRYTRHATELKAVLLHMAVFIVFGSAIWALVPLVARFELGTGAGGYGILLAAAGAGSLIGAAIMPHIRHRFSVNFLIATAELVFAGATISLGFVTSLPLAIFAMFASGIAWLTLVSNFNVIVQTVVPSWVHARALGMYWMIFIGGMAIASYLWGVIADLTGVPAALMIAGISLVIFIPVMQRVPVTNGIGLDMSPARCWKGSHAAPERGSDAGPVFVTRKYRVNPDRERGFLDVMVDVGRLCLRDGAVDWRLIRDIDDTSLFVEVFMVESWAEHLRQHERITVADLVIEEKARAYRVADAPSAVRHFVSAYPRGEISRDN
jgi:MFS family permease